MDIISEFENGDTIARIDGYDMPLYAAAPDLLAALEGLLPYVAGSESFAEQVQAAQDAITLAKGN